MLIEIMWYLQKNKGRIELFLLLCMRHDDPIFRNLFNYQASLAKCSQKYPLKACRRYFVKQNPIT